MIPLNDYIVIEKVFNQEKEVSGIIHVEKFPENKCKVIYSGHPQVKPDDIVVFKHHDTEIMENGKKLWFIHPSNILAVAN